MNSLDSTIPLLRLFWKASWIALIQKFHRPGYLSLGKDLPGRSAEKTDEEDLPGRSGGKICREDPQGKTAEEDPPGTSPGKLPRERNNAKKEKPRERKKNSGERKELRTKHISFALSAAAPCSASVFFSDFELFYRSHSTFSGRTARTEVAPARTAVAQPVQRSRRHVQRSRCPYSGYAARPTVTQPVCGSAA